MHKTNYLTRICTISLLLSPFTNTFANGDKDIARIIKESKYKIGIVNSVSHHKTPLWLTANQYGLSSVKPYNGFLNVSLSRDSKNDSLRIWRIGYIADFAVAYNNTSIPFIHQLAANIDYKRASLSIGSKEECMSLKNNELSSGSQTFGINARPIPQIRLSLPDYWCFTGKKHPWGAIRGFISYGVMTDGKFQRDYVLPSERYSRKVLYHAKAGFLRLGNPEKFPLTFEGGIEMATQFGGIIYNYQLENGLMSEPIHMSHTFKDFVNSTFGIGNDPTDGIYKNATGNTVGSWLFRLNYKYKDWTASVYYDHYFEDHSQLFFEYGWLDGLIGVELSLPKNRFLSNIVYEFLKTTYQSGPLYHDRTDLIPDQISGNDKYYNHGLYAGWQHWGQAIGNPLFISPLYDNDGKLAFKYNRFKAHHVGLSGNPLRNLHYRFLYTFERNWGTYDDPLEHSKVNHSVLLEATYSPTKIGKWNANGWLFGLGLALDKGSLIGHNTGFQIKIYKSGLLLH